ncbi:Dymeclin [Aphelenchoides fujianensis]|nr:Dymeclin [Aphelenchoides fujianensis]
MGAAISTVEELEESDLLKRLAGPESISDNDPFWNKLFSFNFNLEQFDRNVQRSLMEKCTKHLENLLHNTANSGNFATLIRVFLRRAGEVGESVKCENKIFLWQVSNALLILRYICTFLTVRLSCQELVKTMEPKRRVDEDDNDIVEEEGEFAAVAEEFVHALVDIVTDVAVNADTMVIHAESIRTLLALLSSQLYQERVTEDSIFLAYLMRLDEKSKKLICRLMENFFNHADEIPTFSSEKPADSFVISFASSMWSALSRTVSTEEPPPEVEAEQDAKYPPQSLASLSVAFFLILVCRPKFDNKENKHKEMLSLFQNAQEVSSLANLEASFKLDCTALYNRLCATCHAKQPMLLLYMLLHTNSGFRNFVLSRINLENLVVPVLKVLNDGLNTKSYGSHSHQTYLAMIVILILSEDDFFCKMIHEVSIKNINWYQPDRPIADISLGGLTIAVFCKTLHTNMIKTRDRYLHTNCLAALANMSSSFKHLSPYVSQKLIGLLEAMTKRHAKMIQRLRETAEDEEQPEDEESLGSDLHRDITALEEGIRMVLEVINCALCSNLRNNANLIYSILYKRELFEQHHHHPMFHDLVWNIYLVINHFTSRVTDTASSSVDVVLEAIEKAAVQWPTDRLKKFPALKYRYVEDENTVDFFVPYAWRLIFENAGVHFDAALIKLFNAANL